MIYNHDYSNGRVAMEEAPEKKKKNESGYSKLQDILMPLVYKCM